MRKALASAVLLMIAVGAEPASSSVRLSDFLKVLGRVTASSLPSDNALIIAFNLGNFQAWQTSTNAYGEFRLPPLPAGVYRIIAVKQGFSPAITTITPNRTDHNVALKLRPGVKVSKEDRDQIWEIRRSLPPDILRQLDVMLAEEQKEPPSFHGQMVSLTGVAPARSGSSFAQTAVGVRGAFSGWEVDVKGDFHVLNPTNGDTDTLPERIAEAAGVSMEISSNDDSYRIVSTRQSWQVNGEIGTDRAGDLEAHRIEWNRAHTKVALRYFAQENLFAHDQSQLVELTGQTMLRSGPRSDFAILVRVGQESPLSHSMALEPQRIADVAASGRYEVVDAVQFHYGLRTRFAGNEYEWAPQTAAEIRLAEKVSFFITALYKMIDDESLRIDEPPTIVIMNDAAALAPRSRYSVGLVAGDPSKGGAMRAIATVTEIDSVVRIVFDERFEPWWEGLDLQPGDVHHDLAVALQKHIGQRFAFDISTSAGRAAGDEAEKTYVVGSLQSLYRPSGTSLDVSYRRVVDGELSETEKLNLRMGQSLRLPLDLRVLLGVDLARSTESLVAQEYERRLVGGVSLAF